MSKVAPPFRADHVGSLLRPPEIHEARGRRARGEIDDAELRGIEDKAIAEMIPKLEATGIQQHHRRRVPARVVPSRLPPAARRRDRVSGQIESSSDPQETVHMTPPKISVTGKLRHAAPDPGRGLPIRRRAHEPDTEGRHPVTDDGALPRRSRRYRHRVVPRPRRVLRRSCPVLPRRDRRAVRSRLPVPATRRHQPRLPVRSRHAPGCGRPRRRPRRTPADVRRVDQPCARRAPRRPHRRHPPLPRQLPQHPLRERRATKPSPRSCSTRSTSMRTSSSTTTSARATSRRCASSPTTRRWCWESSRRSGPSSRTRTSCEARIHEAAEYVDLDRMCLSPQCGFSSTIHGNEITEDDQWAKLRHVVEVAESVWN